MTSERQALVRGTNDLIKGNGTSRGYFRLLETDGDLLFGTYESTVQTVAVDGRSTTSSQGKWLATKGTGKWQNRNAAGTFKSKVIGDGMSLTEWEGIWDVKR
jgi:hypothetical protein